MASVDRLSTFMIHAIGADSKDITVTGRVLQCAFSYVQ
uniref:Uncharacterized protein n=1 Tax=Parascaris equorum TaxID=6256 RepID=A0A914R6M8_PAREQ